MRRLLPLLVFCVSLYSDTGSLAQSAYWKKLLHFDGHKTFVASHDFYLSRTKPLTLENELNATIEAFAGPNNKEMICKYPARYTWLKTQIDLPDFNVSECEGLNAAVQSLNKDEVYLVTKIDNTGSLRSIMGHTLLLFKNDGESFDSSHSLDFVVSSEDGGLRFLFNTFIGKYKMRINHQLFYTYLNASARHNDPLKISKLNLSKEQKQLIAYHAYELKDVKFDYYYLTANCTTYLSELLSMADDSEFVFDPYNMPIESQIIYNHQIDHDGYLTVNDYNYEPLRYWCEYSTEERLEFLNSVNLTHNCNAVKKLNLAENNRANEFYIRTPSYLMLRYSNQNNLDAAYSYYEKELLHDYGELEPDIQASTFGATFSRREGRWYLKEINNDLSEDMFRTNRSYYLHLGANRKNTGNDLVVNSEMGYGINQKFEHFKLIARLDVGHQNEKVYLQPNIFFKTKIANNQYLDFNYFHDFIQSNYHAVSLNYLYRYNKNFELDLNYMSDNSIYQDTASVAVKYLF